MAVSLRIEKPMKNIYGEFMEKTIPVNLQQTSRSNSSLKL